jgi:hypothetical protein
VGNESTPQNRAAEARPLRLVGGDRDSKWKVLFLGYSERVTPLIDDLIANDCEVWHTEDKFTSTSGFDLVVSYGYRHILGRSIIDSSPAPIVNLHISYLPWNRGAQPNFWAAFDGTPNGVSVHLIDEGLDTGMLIYQKLVDFDRNEKSFSETYARLVAEIEELFRANIPELLAGEYLPYPQVGSGSIHRAADLPSDFRGWDSDVRTEIARLRREHPEL